MKRTIIKLTESDLHRIIKESVKKVINEIEDDTVARAAGKPKEYRDRMDQQYGQGSREAKASRN